MEENQKLEKYLLLTDKIAEFSKDPSTKVGAIFLNKDETAPRSFGYNGMPRGLDDKNEVRNQRPEKYFWYEHAERNAIYNIAREVLQDHIIFCTRLPNMEGARAIVSSGIKKVITYNISHFLLTQEEQKMNQRVRELLKETNVEIVLLERDNQKQWNNHTYHKYFQYMEIVEEYANAFSPDREKKNASMILNKDTFSPIENGFGVNAPPSSIVITEEMHGEDKKFWFQEAEKNAIFNAVKQKFENTTAITCWCPCIHCSLAMVSVGINKIVTRKLDFTQDGDKRWRESFERSQNLYKVAGVEFKMLDLSAKQHIVKNKNGFK